MPYINIRITRDGVTPGQKAELIRRTTKVLLDVLGEDPRTTMRLIDETAPENRAIAGQTLASAGCEPDGTSG